MSEHQTPLAGLLERIDVQMPTSRASIMRRILEKLPLGAFWNIRGAKAKLSDMYKAAAEGKPQVLQRKGDLMPVVVISLDTLCDVTMRLGPERLYDLVRRQAGVDVEDVTDDELEDVLAFRGISGVAVPNLDGIMEFGKAVTLRRSAPTSAAESRGSSAAAAQQVPSPVFRHWP